MCEPVCWSLVEASRTREEGKRRGNKNKKNGRTDGCPEMIETNDKSMSAERDDPTK